MKSLVNSQIEKTALRVVAAVFMAEPSPDWWPRRVSPWPACDDAAYRDYAAQLGRTRHRDGRDQHHLSAIDPVPPTNSYIGVG